MRAETLLFVLFLQLPLAGAVPPGVAAAGGAVTAVTAANGRVYAGSGARLLVFERETRTGASSPLGDLVRGIAVQDGRAFVAAGAAGLAIFDVSKAGDPVLIGSLDTPGYAEGVACTGTLALVADGPLGLRVVDVSDPKRPVEIGAVFEGRQAMAVAVLKPRVEPDVRRLSRTAGSLHALVTAGGAGLLVADLSNPAKPVEIASVPTPGYATGIALSRDTAFVMDSWAGIEIFNVANPAQPFLAGKYATAGWAVKGAVADSTLAVADAFGGVRVLNISDPLHPAETGASAPYLGDAADVALDGYRIWVADRHEGLRTVAPASGSASTTAYDAFAGAWSVAISGHYAYVAALGRGLRILDISDPARPQELGSYPVADAVGVTVNGHYVYVSVGFGDETAGFHVVDVSDPRHPRRASFLPNSVLPPGIPREHTSAGPISYVSNEAGVSIIDATDPANPVVASFFQAPGGGPTLGVAVHDKRMYVAQESFGLLIVDVSDPKAPKLLGTEKQCNAAQDVAVAGKLAFVVGMGGSCVVDVSDPANPRSLRAQLGAGRGATLDGSRGYLGTSGAGIQVLDLTTPGTPVAIGSYRTPGYSRKGVVQDGRLWIANAEAGVWSVPLAAINPVQAFAANIMPGLPALVRPRRPNLAIPVLAPAARPKENLGAAAAGGSCIVTSSQDGGPGSLRGCMAAAGAGGTITFDPAVFQPKNPIWIWLASPLPALTQGGVTIDASSAGVALDGNNLGAEGNGFVLLSDGNTIRGFHFSNFKGTAVLVSGAASRNVIGGDRSQGAGPNGQGNLFDNNGTGIALTGAGATQNTILGNYMGAQADGIHAAGWMNNSDDRVSYPCVLIAAGAHANRMGSTVPGERNVLGGCGWPAGLLITGAETADNVIIGNYIGVNATGANLFLCREDTYCGGGQVMIQDRASRNRIGGDAPGERNVISGAPNCGICFNDLGTFDNAIIGNYIGTNATGTLALPNANFGIWLDGQASRTRIERNLISGKDLSGIATGGDYNVILGNRFGTDASGTAALGQQGGIFAYNMTRRNRIGGSQPGEANVIFPTAGPNGAWAGVSITGPGTESNYVIGNLLGTDASGAALPLGGDAVRGRYGVQIWDGSKYNVVGGSADAEANIIAGSGGDGVWVGNEGVSYTFIGRNWIGTNRDGASGIGNRLNGIDVATDHTFIFGNHIAGNGAAGVENSGEATTVRVNSIHDNASAGISLRIRTGTPAPAITAVSAGSVTGTACAGCLVEVFSDSGDEGASFEGAVRASATGAFRLDKAGGFRGPNLTATATSAGGLTSGFSAPVKK